MKKIVLFSFLICSLVDAQAQVQIGFGTLMHLSAGTRVVTSQDVNLKGDVYGSGAIVLKGTTQQSLDGNSRLLYGLIIDNTAGVLLTSSLKVMDALVFTNGRLKTSSASLTLGPQAAVWGADNTHYICTTNGQVVKELNADQQNYLLPVGTETAYRPAWLTTAGASYSNGKVGIRALDGATASKPPMIANYLLGSWPVVVAGISGGSITIKGQYAPSDVSGSEAALTGYYFNGTDWSSAGGALDAANHQITAQITGSGGEVSAMNRFVLAGARAFLQGAYNSSTGLMSDALRSGTNLIPLEDPYRTAPYTASFQHVNNTIIEKTTNTILQNQTNAADDIVDWVFLELHNTAPSPGNVILQTRSALLQRDGDIVDVDGVSPVTFNNTAGGSYALAVRHRNHLGLSTDPSANPRALTEQQSLAFSSNLIDFRTSSDGQLYGASDAFASASHPTLGTIKQLWAGNVNANTNVRFTGLLNDKDPILVSALNNDPSAILSNVYHPADINMNRVVRYNGLSNDKDFLFIQVMGSNTVAQKTQALPN